jgi:hypothetical protein
LGGFALLFCGSILSVVAAIELLSDLRIHFATPPRADADAAAVAVNSTPWRDDARRAYALALWHSGRLAQARHPLESALRLAPADATLWLRYEILLVAIAPDDPMLIHAAERVNTLGPNETELLLTQAEVAAQNWHRVSLELRRLWLPNLHYAVAHDHDAFLLRSFSSGADINLCTEQTELGLENWCAYAIRIRLACAGAEAGASAQWCASINMPVPRAATAPAAVSKP